MFWSVVHAYGTHDAAMGKCRAAQRQLQLPWKLSFPAATRVLWCTPVRLGCQPYAHVNVRSMWHIDFQHPAPNNVLVDVYGHGTLAPASPEVNMRGRRPDALLARHPDAPLKSQWVSGVLLPPKVQLRNGTWSPRCNW
jgi:hypothetical protein